MLRCALVNVAPAQSALPEGVAELALGD